MVYIIGGVIFLLNFILTGYVYPWMAGFKKCLTKTETMLSTCQRNAIGAFINTAIMTFTI